MGRRLYNLYFDTTYYPVAAFSCAFFLYIYRYASPKLSSKLCARYTVLTTEGQVDWNNRVNSTVHSVIVSCMCAYTMLYDDEIAEEPIWVKYASVTFRMITEARRLAANRNIVMFFLEEPEMLPCVHIWTGKSDGPLTNIVVE